MVIHPSTNRARRGLTLFMWWGWGSMTTWQNQLRRCLEADLWGLVLNSWAKVIYPPHTHTHPFNGPFSGTTRMSRYQKNKSNLDYTGARDSEWQWHLLGMCKSATRSRQITTPAPHHSVFYRPDAPPAAQPTASKHWRHCISHSTQNKLFRRHSSQPISWPGTGETQPSTIKANNIRTK